VLVGHLWFRTGVSLRRKTNATKGWGGIVLRADCQGVLHTGLFFVSDDPPFSSVSFEVRKRSHRAPSWAAGMPTVLLNTILYLYSSSSLSFRPSVSGCREVSSHCECWTDGVRSITGHLHALLGLREGDTRVDSSLTIQPSDPLLPR
jgi:hypothetical protein